MIENVNPEIIINRQREFFRSGATRGIDFRRDALKRLLETVIREQDVIHRALYSDLRKSEFEAFASETSAVIGELKLFIRKIKSWSTPKRARIAMVNQLASGRIWPEPYGCSLIFSAWNYPYQLALLPLIGAVAAGNCVILKPSELASATAKVITDIIASAFSPEHVAVVCGDAEIAGQLLSEKFDKIFFTGSPEIGRCVMRAASEHLTPVTLELGGKSPCIVDCDAKIGVAAKRIVWGKFLNAGQTCVAPDYLMVHERVKAELLTAMAACLKEFFGDNPALSPDYPRIINERHFERIAGLMHSSGKMICGGTASREDRFIAPTIIDKVDPESPLMREEIFGPLLPVLEFSDLSEAIEFINNRPKPLALYYFSENAAARKRIIEEVSAGGVCINETVTHLTNDSMPFGGVGESGMGAYHGKFTFDEFTHYKPVMTKATWLDLPLRYPPFRDKIKYLKRLLG